MEILVDAVGMPPWPTAASIRMRCWFLATIGCLPFPEEIAYHALAGCQMRRDRGRLGCNSRASFRPWHVAVDRAVDWRCPKIRERWVRPLVATFAWQLGRVMQMALACFPDRRFTPPAAGFVGA